MRAGLDFWISRNLVVVDTGVWRCVGNRKGIFEFLRGNVYLLFHSWVVGAKLLVSFIIYHLSILYLKTRQRSSCDIYYMV
jgi:hypothetical protein